MAGNRHVVVDSDGWAHGQKPSLLVVIGTGPTYNPNVDVRFNRHAQFYVNPEVATQTRVWQTLAFGNTGGTPQDVQRIAQAKVFDAYQEFPQSYRPSPRSVTDFTQGNADIFHGSDTYGWPPDPVPIYWSPQSQGTAVVLNSFPVYPFSRDVFLLRPNAKHFGEYQEYFTGQPPLRRSVIDTYVTYLDTTIVHGNAKYFPPIGELDYWKISQPITANVLNFFGTYNPATDVTFFRTQAKVFGDYQEYFTGQRITRNVLENLPRPFNPAFDFFFRRQAQVYPPYIDYPWDFFQRWSFEVIVNQLTPPPPPPPLPGQIILPSFLGKNWYEASFDIIQLGLVQDQNPVLINTGVYPPGTVIGQYPLPGTAVFPLTDIILTVETDNLLAAAYDLNVNEFGYFK